MKWKQILAALKAQGYAGSDTDLDAIKSFVTEKNLDFVGSDGKPLDFASALAESKKRRVAVVDDEDESDSDAAKKGVRDAVHATKEADAEDARKGSRGGYAMTPADARRAWERKKYDRLAQNGPARTKSVGATAYSSSDMAEIAGATMRLGFAGSKPYSMRTYDQSIVQKYQTTYEPDQGGSFVPTIMANEFISLREAYGVTRRLLTSIQMGTGQFTVPRRESGSVVYFPGEAGTGTESYIGTGSTTLNATKMVILTPVSSELLNDSPLNFGQIVSEEMAYAFAKKEDEMALSGDGTATYGNVTGIRTALTGMSALISGAGNSWSALTYPNFATLMGTPLEYASENVFVVSKPFFFQVMLKVAVQPGASFGAGGATLNEILNSNVGGMFQGYPVVFSPAMPTATGATQTCALFGDFKKCGYIGDVVNGLQFAESKDYLFEKDLITLRATSRIAIGIHSVGSASAAGPVAGLATT